MTVSLEDVKFDVPDPGRQVIWKCLVEDSALFLRHFLEKLTRERQEVMLQYLRRLIHTFPMLPGQTAFALYNYLVGYIMFQIRSNSEFATQNIANSLTLLWQVRSNAETSMIFFACSSNFFSRKNF